jgi:hypothetical protein
VRGENRVFITHSIIHIRCDTFIRSWYEFFAGQNDSNSKEDRRTPETVSEYRSIFDDIQRSGYV